MEKSAKGTTATKKLELKTRKKLGKSDKNLQKNSEFCYRKKRQRCDSYKKNRSKIGKIRGKIRKKILGGQGKNAEKQGDLNLEKRQKARQLPEKSIENW